MSDEMLHDDELDAVAGGADVMLKAKVSTTAYAKSVLSEKSKSPENPTFKNPQADYVAASNAALSRFRGHP